MRMILTLLLALLPAAPALAQQSLADSSALTQDDILRASLLTGWRMENGHHMAGLHLELAPHWKTYWRAPGSSGIPPEFDWTGSQNLRAVRLHWPSPQVITLNGMQSIGYLDDLVLPVEVVPQDPARPVTLNLTMALGICKDICMPAHVTLTATLNGAGAPEPAIRTALENGPATAAEAGVKALDCEVSPIDDGLRLRARIDLPAQGGTETVVFETADRSIWVDEAAAWRENHLLMAQTDLVPESGAPFALNRSEVTVTVIGSKGSVEMSGCPAP